MRLIFKFCGVAAVVLLVIIALGPATWQPRSGLGWPIDHFVGYFAITSIVCLGWPRPIIVGGVLMFIAALLEALQTLTPDRLSNLFAACYGVGGALAAALFAELFMRAFAKQSREGS